MYDILDMLCSMTLRYKISGTINRYFLLFLIFVIAIYKPPLRTHNVLSHLCICACFVVNFVSRGH
jgi:hypothetical protein